MLPGVSVSRFEYLHARRGVCTEIVQRWPISTHFARFRDKGDLVFHHEVTGAPGDIRTHTSLIGDGILGTGYATSIDRSAL